MAVRQRNARATSTVDAWSPPALLAVAALGWWWSVHAAHAMSSSMGMDAVSAAAFLAGWVAMMAAMMLPAVLPVVRLYARAAARGTVAPIAFFLAGYGVVWSAIGLPAFVAWKALNAPLADASSAAGRVAGAVLVAAAIYQLSPLKAVCLRHCRSPLSFFMQHGTHLDRPSGAAVAGARHGLFCLGCCWMLMAVLVAFGTMQLWWMAGLAALILLEKVSPIGERVARVAGGGFASLGLLLLIHPTTISHLI
jgi:predicted metal-binding membrane protein